MVIELSNDQLKSLDELIQTNQVIACLVFIKQHSECSLGDAKIYLWEREKKIGVIRTHEIKWPDFNAIIERCSKHTPVAIQAIWDGDSAGWILDLEAVINSPKGFASIRIGSRRGAGGDFRFFRGMKVMPEIAKANELGEKIAAHFSIPFYFPAPLRPEIDQPNWWQQDEGEICADCETAFLKSAEVLEHNRCGHCLDVFWRDPIAFKLRAESFASGVKILVRFREDGGTQDQALQLLESMRERVGEELEDKILDLMDLVSGFCLKEFRIWED